MISKLTVAGLLAILLILAAAPAQRTGKLLKGKIEYQPPEGWELSIGSSDDLKAAWVQADGPGVLAIQVMPDNAVINERAAKAIVKQLHENHVKAKDQIILEPSLDVDLRFAIRIHERYKHKDKDEVSDELHLYKAVGSRPCMLTVNAVTADQDEAKKVHEIGEETLLSAKFVRKKTSVPSSVPIRGSSESWSTWPAN